MQFNRTEKFFHLFGRDKCFDKVRSAGHTAELFLWENNKPFKQHAKRFIFLKKRTNELARPSKFCGQTVHFDEWYVAAHVPLCRRRSPQCFVSVFGT